MDEEREPLDVVGDALEAMLVEVRDIRERFTQDAKQRELIAETLFHIVRMFGVPVGSIVPTLESLKERELHLRISLLQLAERFRTDGPLKRGTRASDEATQWLAGRIVTILAWTSDHEHVFLSGNDDHARCEVCDVRWGDLKEGAIHGT